MATIRKQLIQQNHILCATAICAFVIFSLFNYRFHAITDLSHNKRNSLHEDTKKLIDLLQDDISILAFIEKKKDKRQVQKFFKPLLNYKRNISFDFINPVDNPKSARELGYDPEKLIQISYQKKVVAINSINENSIHNALQKLLNKDNHLVAFSSSFGERQPYDDAKFNYSLINQYLSDYNFSIIETNLQQLSNVPENASILVLAAPTETIDSISAEKIVRYIKQGGHILWLADTDSQALPETIRNLLNIKLLDGLIVDANSQNYVQGKPDFVPVDNYQGSTILDDIKTVSIFPQARGIAIKAPKGNSVFTYTPILKSSIDSWTETGLIRGNIAFDENTSEVAGPITIGAALSRNRQEQQDQRIIFLGDADFISNAYLNNGGNINVALRLFRWLTHQQELATINAVIASDKNLALSNTHFFAISLFYIILLPCGLLLTALWYWHKRKTI